MADAASEACIRAGRTSSSEYANPVLSAETARTPPPRRQTLEVVDLPVNRVDGLDARGPRGGQVYVTPRGHRVVVSTIRWV